MPSSSESEDGTGGFSTAGETGPGIWALIAFNGAKDLSGLGFFWFVFLSSFFFFLVLRATPTAYGGSQARRQIRATAASLHHSSRQHWILNPPSKARDQTRNLTVPSWFRFCCATTGTPVFLFVSFCFVLLHLRPVGVPRPGIKSCHSRGPSHCSDTTRSLTHSTTRELLV